jgi:hypothetical protein
MKKLFVVLAGGAAFVGTLALAEPMPTLDAKVPHCLKGKYCGTPEPGSFCPPCYYWETCGPQCGCRPIPSCKL